MKAERIMEVADGSKIAVLPVGTRIRCKEYPKLTGYIKAYEYHKSGKISVIPYNIFWDDEDLAHQKLGFFWIYQTPETVGEVKEDGTLEKD